MIVPLLAALVIGGLAGVWFAERWQTTPDVAVIATDEVPQPDTPAPQHGKFEAALAGVQADLQREIEAREALEMQLIRLEATLTEQATATFTAIPHDETPGPSKTAALVGLDALLDAGIDAGTASWLQEQIDSMDMDELWLNDRAVREGWRRSGRYMKEKQAIRARLATLREELNDADTWDRLLYATNRNNRVILQHIMRNSPAEQYGLQSGDSIISYNGQRIFTSQELAKATTGGLVGTIVLVEVERDGERLNLSLPSGPIGGRLQAARVRP